MTLVNLVNQLIKGRITENQFIKEYEKIEIFVPEISKEIDEDSIYTKFDDNSWFDVFESLNLSEQDLEKIDQVIFNFELISDVNGK